MRLTSARLSMLAVAAAFGVSACAQNDTAPVTAPAPPPQAEPTPAPQPTTRPAAAAPTELPGSQADFNVNAGDRVFFALDESRLSSSAQATLRQQAAWLQQYGDINVVIEGHCDERGTREYNIALGARRANAVRNFLVGQGVDAARITTISYGKERPIDGRSNEEAWSRNRNGHTRLVNPRTS